MPGARRSRPGSWTSTPTCASRGSSTRRRSRRDPGRGARRVHGGRGDGQHGAGRPTTPASSREVRDKAARRGLVRRLPGRRDHEGPGRRVAGRARRDGRGRRAGLQRRRQLRPHRALLRNASCTRRRSRRGRDRRSLRGRLARHGRAHARGRASPSLGLAGRPAEAEEIVVARDLAMARATRRPDAHVPPLERAGGRADPSRQGRRRAGHGGGDAPPPRVHRRRPRGVRHELQGEPSAADGGGSRGVACRRRRRHDRRDRHRPCAARGGGEGVPSSTWHHRARSAWRPPWRPC